MAVQEGTENGKLSMMLIVARVERRSLAASGLLLRLSTLLNEKR